MLPYWSAPVQACRLREPVKNAIEPRLRGEVCCSCIVKRERDPRRHFQESGAEVSGG